MIRVLVSGFTSNIGGVETFIINTYMKMNRDEIVFDVITNTKHPSYEKEIIENGGKIYYIPSRGKNFYKYKKSLKDFYYNHAVEYDIYWCNKCILSNIDFLIMAKKYNIPNRIIHSHNSANMDTGIKGFINMMLHKINSKKIYKFATEYWACSDTAAKWFGFKEDNYKMIPNGIDVGKFKFNKDIRNDMRKELNINGKFVIGHVGTFVYVKNHEFLIKIFKKLHEIRKDSILMLIGEGELMECIKNQVKSMGIEKSVIFLGKRSDVNKLMQAMDCFVLPSRFEGLPVVAVEAQAADLPCIVAKDGVTSKTKLTDKFEFLSFSDSDDKWVEEILSVDLNRRDMSEIIKEKGFEAKTQAKNIQDIFKEMKENEIKKLEIAQ